MAHKRLQVIHGVDRFVVVELVAEADISDATLQQWAQAVADLADQAVGEPGAHYAGILPRSNHAHNIGIKPRGNCNHCGGLYALNKLGQIIQHGKQYGTRSKERCKGSLKKPKLRSVKGVI